MHKQLRWSFVVILVLLGGVLHLNTPEQYSLAMTSAPRAAFDLGLLQDIVQISAGNSHTCALTAAGGVKCWGDNWAGQLGNNSTVNSSVPVDVSGLSSGVSAISAGDSHTCAVTTPGGVKCWGYNSSGQLGNNNKISSGVPVDVSNLSSGVSTISAGRYHTCALSTSGGVKCWGYNKYGQLGNNSTVDNDVPVAVSGLSSGVTAISSGGIHTCALTTSGVVKCWGSNYSGQLGNNSSTDSSVPIDVNGPNSDVRMISAGGWHTCALTTANGIKCWGNNTYGQLGNNSTANSSAPIDVDGLNSSVNAISAGDWHICALTTVGSAKCWGHNNYGQLGNNSTIDSSVSVDVSGLGSDVSAISAGGNHTCALTTAGGVKCWGSNYSGQLGNAQAADSHMPVNVINLSSAIRAISAGNNHVCVLNTYNGVECWGANNLGQLGNASTTDSNLPVVVSNLNAGIKSVSAGGSHTCALTINENIKCWGNNYERELGNADMSNSSVPVDVSNLSDVKALSTGGDHTCILDATNGVKCWGYNSRGQLGNDSINTSSVPVAVIGMSTGVSAVSAGIIHTCDLTTTGGVKCWGGNTSGQLGNNSNIDSHTPVDVSDLSDGVRAISAGQGHTCALISTGGVKCWGDNDFGQLGNNSRADSYIPVDVSGLSSDVSAITTGTNFTCALLTTGGVKCWGDNRVGQLGNDSTTTSSVPVDVSGLGTGVSTISAGENHVCALIETGSVKCWGRNVYGQLGDGNAWHTIPVDVLDPNAPAVTPTSTITATATATSTTTPTSTPTPTATATPTPTPPDDSHEPNDTCNQAQPITTDGAPQTHTFHREGDVDWIRLDATQGTRYRIEVEIPYGSPADVNLELYSACESLPLETWDKPYTPGARLTFQATSDGSLYLRMDNVDATVYGPQVQYQLSVRALVTERPIGAAIIVAGRLRGADELQRNIHNVTNDVFKLFQANGYTADDITYLATDSTLPGRDVAATAANLQAAITTWAATKVGPDRALTIYLMDHGGIGKFYIDDLNNEYVTPAQLNEWLTTLENQVDGVKINLIIEACHAGSFIQATPSLSKAGRVIIASTNVENDAYASRYGAHFSDQFLAALSQGTNLYSSFFHARSTVRRLYPIQDPWLDANGDQIPNDAVDAALAAERGFGAAGTFDDIWPPYIATVQGPININDGRGVIEAEVYDNGQVESVWAVIYPPSYSPSAGGDELVPEALDTILLQPQGNNRYRAAYASFTEIGVYRVTVHAEDDENLVALPQIIEVVNGSRLFLPLVNR